MYDAGHQPGSRLNAIEVNPRAYAAILHLPTVRLVMAMRTSQTLLTYSMAL